MKFYLDTFKKYKKILSMYYNKDNPYSEAIKISFKDNYAYFLSSYVNGRVKIKHEDMENENDIVINMDDILRVSENIDSLEKIEKDIYIFNDNKIKLPQLDVEIDNFILSYDKQDNKLIDFITNNFFSIKEAFSFMTQEKGNNLNAVFIDNNNIVSSDNALVTYVNKIESIDNFNLSSELLKIIFILGEENSFKIYSKQEIVYDRFEERNFTKENLILSINDEFDIFINGEYNLQCPPIKDETFVDMINLKSYLKINLNEFFNIISFLKNFTLPETNNVIKFSIKDNKLIIAVDNTSSISIEKSIDLIENSFEQEFSDIFLNSIHLRKALMTFDGNDIKLIFSNESPLVIISQDYSKIIGLAKYV